MSVACCGCQRSAGATGHRTRCDVVLDWCCLNATAGPHYTNLDGVDVSDGDCGDDCDIDGHDDCRGMAKVFSFICICVYNDICDICSAC